MFVWVAMAVWGGVVNLTVVLINWRGRVSYERARAESVVAMIRAVELGGIMHDERPDGTVLRAEIPSCREAREAPQWQHLDAEGDGVANRR